MDYDYELPNNLIWYYIRKAFRKVWEWFILILKRKIYKNIPVLTEFNV